MPPKGRSQKQKATYKCETCSYTTHRLGIYEDHKRTHTGERPFCCHVCGKGFTQKSNLGQHLKIHGEGKQTIFKCEECDFTTKWKSSLQIHARWHRGEKPYKCKYCDKAFSQSTHCRTHVRESHTDERKFQCDQCSKWFKRQEHLEKHQVFHSEVKNFACPVCAKRFHGESSLKQHKKIHLGEAGKVYKCDQCPYKSYFNNSLKVHYRTHTGVKPYSCPQCNKKFRTSGIVKIHVRMVHQGAAGKIFHCDRCQFSTANKQSLRYHLYRVHLKTNPPLKCKFCPKEFQSKTVRQKHMREVHFIDPTPKDAQRLKALLIKTNTVKKPRRAAKPKVALKPVKAEPENVYPEELKMKENGETTTNGRPDSPEESQTIELGQIVLQSTTETPKRKRNPKPKTTKAPATPKKTTPKKTPPKSLKGRKNAATTPTKSPKQTPRKRSPKVAAEAPSPALLAKGNGEKGFDSLRALAEAYMPKHKDGSPKKRSAYMMKPRDIEIDYQGMDEPLDLSSKSKKTNNSVNTICRIESSVSLREDDFAPPIQTVEAGPDGTVVCIKQEPEDEENFQFAISNDPSQ